jgi:hypothetical protein
MPIYSPCAIKEVFKPCRVYTLWCSIEFGKEKDDVGMCVCVCLIYGVCSITIYRPPTQLLNPRPPNAQPPPPLLMHCISFCELLFRMSFSSARRTRAGTTGESRLLVLMHSTFWRENKDKAWCMYILRDVGSGKNKNPPAQNVDRITRDVTYSMSFYPGRKPLSFSPSQFALAICTLLCTLLYVY